jgi:hypothetical protein
LLLLIKNEECSIGVALGKFVITLRTLFSNTSNLFSRFSAAWPREEEEYMLEMLFINVFTNTHTYAKLIRDEN